MSNQEQSTQIKIETYQKMTELELDALRRENFSLKVVIAQLQENYEELSKACEQKGSEELKLNSTTPDMPPLMEVPNVPEIKGSI